MSFLKSRFSFLPQGVQGPTQAVNDLNFLLIIGCLWVFYETVAVCCLSYLFPNNFSSLLLVCKGLFMKSSNHLSGFRLSKRSTNKRKLKHQFYSPNIQSKSIKDSQTRTVQIQLFFPVFYFFFLRHRWPVPENSGLPKIIYTLSSSCTYCMFMVIVYTTVEMIIHRKYFFWSVTWVFVTNSLYL